ncbi:ATP-binding protein [Tissierella sp.]|uniref:ATP-binding protein n=1 Tax=Tissierella sp. TaxID=41274 RepID=UPI0028620054|nr:ATP-binding protein [Tissierella sp.]MDR7857094.1 ATP-binding protein [Tissierella sp.]
MAKIRRMFPGGNTSQGFYSLHSNIISNNRNKLYIFKGMPGGGKSSLMKLVGERMITAGYNVEYHHCPSDPESVDAVLIEDLKIALLDGTAPHTMDPEYPGLTDTIIDLAEFIDSSILKGNKEDIIRAKIANKEAYRKAFSYLKAAGILYKGIEEDNKSNIDIREINNQGNLLIEKIFSKEKIHIESNGFQSRHLFSTAYTPDGYVDYTDSILKWIEDIYFINGEIGTGKSIILNRVLEEAQNRNYQTEVYYNSLIPNKVETVFIKEIDTAITSNLNGDKLGKAKIDLNSNFDISKLNKEDYNIFNQLVEKGIESLNNAKENHFILERSYKPSIDYSKLAEVKEKICKEIMSYK